MSAIFLLLALYIFKRKNQVTMATDLGVTRPPAKLSRHLRPPGWGSHSLLVCLSEGYSSDVELVRPLESRMTDSFSGPGTTTGNLILHRSQGNSDLGGTSEREDAAKRWDCRRVCKKLGGGEDRVERRQLLRTLSSCQAEGTCPREPELQEGKR